MRLFIMPGYACMALACLLAGVEISAAQDDSQLRFLVISGDDGNPLAGANVLLYEYGYATNDHDPYRYCVTNSDGFCEIRNIPPARLFTLRITFIGYQSFEVDLALSRGERILLRPVLEPYTEQIDEVTIDRQRYVTTGEAGVRRIGVPDIARVPAPGVGGDLVSYLQTLPGVVTSGDRGGELYIRGGTSDQNLILVDNLHIYKPFHISNLFSAFPDEVIQSADLYAGGFGAEFAGATSAVLDVRLRPGNMRRHQGNAAFSPYLLSVNLEGPLETDRQSYMLMARKSTIETFAPTLTGEEVPLNFSDILARYTIQETSITCNVTGVYTSDRGEIVPYRGIVHAWSNTVIGARCIAFDERFNHPAEVTAGYTGYRNTEGSEQVTERSSAINQLFLNIDLRTDILRLPVHYGFGIKFRTYTIDLAERFTSLRSLRRTIPIANLYSTTEWSPVTGITIQPGIASQFSLDNSLTFEPRLRISYRPGGSDRQEFSLAAGRYVQFMSGISDERDAGTVFTVLQPTETGDPLPSALHGIFAYQQRFGRYVIANLEGFVKRHSNVPVSKWNPEPKIEIETALADGFTYGFDVRLMVDRNPVYLSAGYGWSKVDYEAVSGDLGAWIQEPVFSYSPAHDQRHKLNVIAGYRFAGFTAGARWEFGTGMPFTQILGFDMAVRVPAESPVTDPGQARMLFSRPYGERLPYYHRLDVSIGRSFRLAPNWSLETEAGVINIYNRNNIFNFDMSTLMRVDQTPFLPYLSVKLNLL
ncbi:MAG: TonB-dependent receptor plug domain-containing protein [Cyclonatronaceae bacterium]